MVIQSVREGLYAAETTSQSRQSDELNNFVGGMPGFILFRCRWFRVEVVYIDMVSYARAHDGVEMGRERVGDLQCRQHPGEANNL